LNNLIITFFLIFIFWSVLFFILSNLRVFSFSRKIVEIEAKIPRFLPWLVLFLAFVFYFAINYFIYNAINVFDRDFPSNVQVIWKLSQGIKPITTIFNLYFLENHWTLIFIPIALLYKLCPHPLFIIAINILAFLGGAAFVYLIALDRLKSNLLSLSILFSLIMNPYVYRALIIHANSDVYSFLFIAMAFYFLLKNKTPLFLLASFLAMSCKEDVSLYFIAIGLWMIFSEKKYKLGALLSLFSFCYFVFIVKVAMPFYSESIFLVNFNRSYGYLGSNIVSIIETILFRPQMLINHMISLDVLIGAFFVLAPVLLFVLFSGSAIFLLILPFLVKLISTSRLMLTFTEHHIWHPLFFIYFSMICGLVYLSAKEIKNVSPIAMKHFMSITLIVVTIINTFLWSIPMIEYSEASYKPLSFLLNNERAALKRAAINMVPEKASLFADAEFLSYSPNRDKLYEINSYSNKTIFEIINEVDYCVFDFKSMYSDDYLNIDKPIVLKFLSKDSRWKIIFSIDSILVFQRK
jgi:uncharacterized membrane protein